MRIKIDKRNTQGDISNNRKEAHFKESWVVVNKNLEEVIVVRWYASKHTHWCCFWVHDRKPAGVSTHVAGGARASGYGYCKQSTAFEGAAADAGVTSSKEIAGRGMSSVEEFLKTLMNKLGHRKHAIIKAHA